MPLFLLILLTFFLNISLLDSKTLPCDRSLFVKEKDLKNIFRHLRYNSSHCKPGWFIYSAFSQRALVAKHYATALWASNKGLNLRNMKTLRLLKSEALIGLKRYEEAIVLLKPLAFGSYPVEFRYRAHLKLIHCYYLKNSAKKDVNVNYLLALFRKNYPAKGNIYKLMLQNLN